LLRLPNELIDHTVSYLDAPATAATSSVCRQLHERVEQRRVWAPLVRDAFGVDVPRGANAKAAYRDLLEAREAASLLTAYEGVRAAIDDATARLDDLAANHDFALGARAGLADFGLPVCRNFKVAMFERRAAEQDLRRAQTQHATLRERAAAHATRFHAASPLPEVV
jgi:hypothetical protein